MSVPLPQSQNPVPPPRQPIVAARRVATRYPPLQEIAVSEDMSLFSDLKKEIDSCAAQVDSLNRFKMLLSSDGKDCFDAEDVKMIKRAMESAVERRKELESSLKNKINVYNANYLNLQRTIQKRKMVLDDSDATSVLEQDRDLLEFFTEKQIKLEDLLVQTKDKLEDGFKKKDRRDSVDSVIEHRN